MKPHPAQTTYDNHFYEQIEGGAICSAKVILPIVQGLINPKSVVDIGCGRGAWLSVWKDIGVIDTLGIDGEYIDQSLLLIDKTRFIAADLNKPLVLNRAFDLAQCLEVAEHLPPSSARQLVEQLTSLAPTVLFSAAIPGQGGNKHVNEQWPCYWENLFSEKGFKRIDAIRRHVFQNHDVEWWYQQNIYLYTANGMIEKSEKLRKELDHTQKVEVELLHVKHVRRYKRSIRQIATRAYQTSMQAIREILSHTFRR
jgi:SAM-dependent methyltransferase